MLTISRLEVVSFPSNALLWSLSSEATWVVRASSGALVWKHVICGCCRVTSQKRLSYRLQALSSLFFAVMPSILRIRLDGWFSRCRGQSSGKSASRQRSYERYSRDVQEPIDVHAKRAICDSRVVFNSLTCPCPRVACRIRLSVWGGAPPMSRLAGVDQKFCDISCTFGIDKLTDLYTCIIMQGAQI